MYKNILLAVDLNDESSWKKALPEAVEYCKAFKAKLHMMAVVPDFVLPSVAQMFPEGYEDQAIALATKDLKALAAKGVPKDVTVDCNVCYGTIYSEILKTAKQGGVDLIVLASHRPALKDFLLGPNAARVVRHANCSVLVVRN
jgi:nucleotide-binding universal stress UspA family protein